MIHKQRPDHIDRHEVINDCASNGNAQTAAHIILLRVPFLPHTHALPQRELEAIVDQYIVSSTCWRANMTHLPTARFHWYHDSVDSCGSRRSPERSFGSHGSGRSRAVRMLPNLQVHRLWESPINRVLLRRCHQPFLFLGYGQPSSHPVNWSGYFL